MLSYRHAYHAGNFADILKHLVLVNTLHYALRKDTPLFYLDTHAGAGLYLLESDAARKTGEADAGILKLDFAALLEKASVEGAEAVKLYQDAVGHFLRMHKPAYPGSPLIALRLPLLLSPPVVSGVLMCAGRVVERCGHDTGLPTVNAAQAPGHRQPPRYPHRACEKLLDALAICPT
jgi:hypothetical protein